MKIQLSKIFSLYYRDQANKPIISKLFDQNLPIKVAFDLKNEIQKLDSFMNNLDERRNALIKSLGEPTNDGQGLKVKPENEGEFHKTFNALLQEEIEVDIKKMPISKLGDIKLTVNELSACDFLFDLGK